ncbi:serine hydrolase [Nonomuraea sp. NEAU-A123]|uniref:serine hydrolase domain-containing protein n=1 Tax=Nonomuraea sp. NEAU-A123 TaxID=2839649 RepID=UPI001BE463BD|nr:serine hydrolase domain-containing protein [Nonomuraea sp. NEAU-A123]MBT2234372.1 beta-lactamase family protein [Nonomuraea sp. NEAU-A123]
MKPKLIGTLAAATALIAALSAPAAASTVQAATSIGRGASTAELTPAAIDAYLGKVMDATGLPGISVVVTHNDQVIHAAGYGQGSDGKPVTADTPMRVASLSKSFTAMAVLTLVDAGKIQLDKPVAQQLPGFHMADPRATTITVRQLLDQTSGLSDTTLDINALEETTSLAQYVDRLKTGTLATDPGTHWAYCNVNYDLAARLVEVAGGQSFDDYLKQHVFAPLGMTHSALRQEAVRPSDGYNSVFGAWVARPELPGFLDGSGSGGVITTAADMGAWLVTQNGKGKQLVTPQSLRTMHTPSKIGDYAMGWSLDGDTKLLVHSGNLFTYTAVEAISPETGYGFAVMTNSAALTDETYAVATGLLAMAEGRTPELPGGGRQTSELVLGLIGLAAAGLGIMGVRRSGRWAARRAGRPGWRIALRMVPVLLPVAVLAAYPDLISFISNGRTVTWAQLTYFAVPITITLTFAALAGVATTVMRLVRLRAGSRRGAAGRPGRGQYGPRSGRGPHGHALDRV